MCTWMSPFIAPTKSLEPQVRVSAAPVADRPWISSARRRSVRDRISRTGDGNPARGEGLAVAGHVAHARRRCALLAAVDPLRFSPQAILSPCGAPGNFIVLHRRRGHVAQCHPAPADQVRRAWQDLQRGHAPASAVSKRILRPDGVLGPDASGDRIRRLVASWCAFNGRAGVDAEVRVQRRSGPGSPSGPARRRSRRLRPPGRARSRRCGPSCSSRSAPSSRRPVPSRITALRISVGVAAAGR